MPFSDTLMALTERSRHAIEALPAMRQMLGGQMSRQQYASFLLSLYPIVSNFCPLMAFAAGHCADRHPHLRSYLYQHIHEEKGHEQMVLADLASIDAPLVNLEQHIPVPPVQAMLAFNYHDIARQGPYAVLGFIYVLEITSSVYGGKVAAAIARGLGLPLSQGFTFLDSHATLDDDHLAELRRMLQSVDQPAEQKIVLNSAAMNFYLFMQVIREDAVPHLCPKS